MPIGFKDLLTGKAKERAYNIGNRSQIALDQIPDKYKNPGIVTKLQEKFTGNKNFKKVENLTNRLKSNEQIYKNVSKATTRARGGVALAATGVVGGAALALTGKHRKAKAVENYINQSADQISIDAQKRVVNAMLQDPAFPLPGKLKILESTGQVKLAGQGLKATMMIGAGALGGLGAGLASENIDNNFKQLAFAAGVGASIPALGLTAYKFLPNSTRKKIDRIADNFNGNN